MLDNMSIVYQIHKSLNKDGFFYRILTARTKRETKEETLKDIKIRLKQELKKKERKLRGSDLKPIGNVFYSVEENEFTKSRRLNKRLLKWVSI